MPIFQKFDRPSFNTPQYIPPKRYEDSKPMAQIIDAKIASIMPWWDWNYTSKNLQAANPRIGIKSVTYQETHDNDTHPQIFTQQHYYIFLEKKALRLEEAMNMYLKESINRKILKFEYYNFRDVPTYVKDKYVERKIKDAQREVLLLRKQKKGF